MTVLAHRQSEVMTWKSYLFNCFLFFFYFTLNSHHDVKKEFVKLSKWSSQLKTTYYYSKKSSTNNSNDLIIVIIKTATIIKLIGIIRIVSENFSQN